MKQTDDFSAARPRRSHLLLVLFALATSSAACSSVYTPDREAPGFTVDSIRQEDMRADLLFLASVAMIGRAATSRDVAITSEFIKARFQRLGLMPGGPENSYFQPFNLVSAALGDGDNSLVIDGIDTGGLRRRSIGDDYYTLNFSASGSGSGELVYAGFGIVEPRLGYNDYQGESVEGKIVLCSTGNPESLIPRAPLMVWSLPSSRATGARRWWHRSVALQASCS